MIIKKYPLLRHLRSEPTAHVMRYRRGELVASGRGLTGWFHPLSTSLVEIPCHDMDQPFLFHARSSDFQDVTVQGVVSYRIAEPERAAERFDFSVDEETGLYRGEPLERIAALLTRSVQEVANAYLNEIPVREALVRGVDSLRRRLREGLVGAAPLAESGIAVITVEVSEVSPTSELEKALSAPEREAIQQASDEAVFRRRALAVEKERAIAENELSNKIELAKREEQLIAQQGANELRRVREEAEARTVAAQSKGEMARIAFEAKANGVRAVEGAQVEAERERMAIYEALPKHVLFGLALRELAENIGKVRHLTLSPSLLDSLVERWSGAAPEGPRDAE